MSVGTSAGLIAAGIGAAGSIGSAFIGKGSANKAANQQSNSAYSAIWNQLEPARDAAISNVGAASGRAAEGVQKATGDANTILQGAQDKSTAATAPYMNAGKTGLEYLQNTLAPGGDLDSLTTNKFAFDPSKIADSPEYQFQLAQGLKGLQQSSAASGALQTGGTLKAITQYGQGLASTSYQNAFNNALSVFNTNRQGTLDKLQIGAGIGNQLAGYGQNANGQYIASLGAFTAPQANNLINASTYSGNADINSSIYAGNARQSTANNIANLMTGAGTAQSAGTVAGGNFLAGGIGGATNSLLNYSTLQQILNQGKQAPLSYGNGGGTSPDWNTGPDMGDAPAWHALTSAG